VCLRFFDVCGATVKTPLDERVMSIAPADLMQVPRRVGVAALSVLRPAHRVDRRRASPVRVTRMKHAAPYFTEAKSVSIYREIRATEPGGQKGKRRPE
jgi:hypothetical protein